MTFLPLPGSERPKRSQGYIFLNIFSESGGGSKEVWRLLLLHVRTHLFNYFYHSFVEIKKIFRACFIKYYCQNWDTLKSVCSTITPVTILAKFYSAKTIGKASQIIKRNCKIYPKIVDLYEKRRKQKQNIRTSFYYLNMWL